MSEESAETRIDPIELFSPAVQEDVRGLAFLGRLTKRFRFCGHSFAIETLLPHTKYTIGQAMDPYRGTLAEPEAHAAFHVALALTSVDGHQDFCPAIGDNLREFVDARFSWLMNDTGWHQPLIDYIFIEYSNLEKRALAGVIEMQSLSERGPDTLQPSPDSLTASAPSEEPSTDSPPSETSS